MVYSKDTHLDRLRMLHFIGGKQISLVQTIKMLTFWLSQEGWSEIVLYYVQICKRIWENIHYTVYSISILAYSMSFFKDLK